MSEQAGLKRAGSHKSLHFKHLLLSGASQVLGSRFQSSRSLRCSPAMGHCLGHFSIAVKATYKRVYYQQFEKVDLLTILTVGMKLEPY